MDKRRVAVWGWSYGGFVAALVLAHPKQNVFQCGISVAPVVSWELYGIMNRYPGVKIFLKIFLPFVIILSWWFYFTNANLIIAQIPRTPRDTWDYRTWHQTTKATPNPTFMTKLSIFMIRCFIWYTGLQMTTSNSNSPWRLPVISLRRAYFFGSRYFDNFFHKMLQIFTPLLKCTNTNLQKYSFLN